MHKNTIWFIPGAFFLIACALNLFSSAQGTEWADLVKPALLPLLTATTLAYLLGRDIPNMNQVGLLVAAQLFGFAGDLLLIPSASFAFFAAGIGAFLIGHVFYMSFFGGQSWKGLSIWLWLIALVFMAAAVFAAVRAIGIHGSLLAPMCVYAFALTLLFFSALAGVLRMPRGFRATWWILLFGALFFIISDACLALSIFGNMTFPLRHLVIMGTYLAAQSLLAVGGVRLILGK